MNSDLIYWSSTGNKMYLMPTNPWTNKNCGFSLFSRIFQFNGQFRTRFGHCPEKFGKIFMRIQADSKGVPSHLDKQNNGIERVWFVNGHIINTSLFQVREYLFRLPFRLEPLRKRIFDIPFIGKGRISNKKQGGNDFIREKRSVLRFGWIGQQMIL